MKNLALFIIFTSFALYVSGQDINVSSEFDTNRIFIGDQIYFTIKIEKPIETNISLPVFKDTLFEKIEIISGPQSDTVVFGEGRNSIINKYLVTSFDSGLYLLPPFFVEINTANGLKRLYSNYSSLEVLRVNIAPVDSTDVIYDIVNPYRVPLTIGEILPWVLLAIVLAFVILYIIRIIKRRRNSVKMESEPVFTEQAHITAFRELEKLRNEQLWQNGELKLYYTRLTEILRQYLEGRYNISSMELTTEETLTYYRKKVKPETNIYNTLKSVLINADLVKFAKFKPGAIDNEKTFEESWSFVSSTMLNPETNELTDSQSGKKNGEEDKV